MSIGPMSAPYVLAPVVAAAQEINVAQPGEEPDPSQPIAEDMRLFDADLVDKQGAQIIRVLLLPLSLLSLLLSFATQADQASNARC